MQDLVNYSYSGIDIMAWLNRPYSQPDVCQKDFEEWVKKYLLPGSGIQCAPTDLYSARCGIIHSFTYESKKAREGKAKKIVYAWGTAKAEDFQEVIDSIRDFNIITLHINKLHEAFLMGVKRFIQSLSDDSKKAKIVYKRANKFFTSLPPLKIKK